MKYADEMPRPPPPEPQHHTILPLTVLYALTVQYSHTSISLFSDKKYNDKVDEGEVRVIYECCNTPRPKRIKSTNTKTQRNNYYM